MEFELEGGNIEAQGNIEVTLPDYIVMLPQEELVEARRAYDRDKMIVAAGRHPTGDIVIMTGESKFMTLKPAHFGIPDGPVIPIDCGHTLAVEQSNGYFEIAADWFIDNAEAIDVTLLT